MLITSLGPRNMQYSMEHWDMYFIPQAVPSITQNKSYWVIKVHLALSVVFRKEIPKGAAYRQNGNEKYARKEVENSKRKQIFRSKPTLDTYIE